MTEEALARELDVSRPTVRQALNTLVGEGILTRHPRTRVLHVTRLSPADVVDAYRARRVLELAGVRAAQTAPPAELDRLGAHVDEMELAVAAGDFTAFVSADTACHAQTVALCGSQYLVDAHRTLMSRLRLAITRVETGDDELHESLAAHQTFRDLIRRAEFDEAARNLDARLTAAEQRLLSDAAAG